MVQIMGILNCTPDSFYDGARDVDALVDYALEMEASGADWIDVGGESTRPGALPVSSEEELQRVLPVLQGIRKKSSIPISIDTTKAFVARAALDNGANLINDVSGLGADLAMVQVVAKYSCPVVLMHSRGNPQTMQGLTNYKNFLEDVRQEIITQIGFAVDHGVKPENIWIDPGFGFAKTAEQNIYLLDQLEYFVTPPHWMVVGLSRKSFLGKIIGQDDPSACLTASLSAAIIAVQKGADVLRVHDVRPTIEALKVLDSCPSIR